MNLAIDGSPSSGTQSRNKFKQLCEMLRVHLFEKKFKLQMFNSCSQKIVSGIFTNLNLYLKNTQSNRTASRIHKHSIKTRKHELYHKNIQSTVPKHTH